MKILDASEISVISVKVTEKIHKKQLVQFLRTSILNSTEKYSKNTHFYYVYVKSSSTYEIIFYDKTSKKILLEPSLLLNLSNMQHTKVLYITPTYFVFFEDNKILFMKKIENTTRKDICTYIEQMYRLVDFEIIDVSLEDIEKLKIEKVKPVLKNLEISLYDDKSYQGFVVFLVFSFCLIIAFFVYSFLGLHIQEARTEIVTKKEKIILLNKPFDKVKDFFHYIETNSIYIKKVSFVNNTIKTTIYDTNKSKLMKVLNKNKKTLKLKSLVYDEENQLYSMEVIIAY